MFCKNCGSNIDDKAVVCPRCGVWLGERAPAPVVSKGNTIAIVGFILSFLVPIAGLVCSVVGRDKAKKEGAPYGGLALAGIVISIVDMVLSIIFSVFYYNYLYDYLYSYLDYGL